MSIIWLLWTVCPCFDRQGRTKKLVKTAADLRTDLHDGLILGRSHLCHKNYIYTELE